MVVSDFVEQSQEGCRELTWDVVTEGSGDVGDSPELHSEYGLSYMRVDLKKASKQRRDKRDELGPAQSFTPSQIVCKLPEPCSEVRVASIQVFLLLFFFVRL